MTPFYSDDWLTLYGGDCLEVLRELPSDSVDCVVTSPPYWGLRDYGTATWSGGDEACDHKAPPSGGTVKGSTLVGTGNRDGFSADGQYRDTCGKCGATRIDSQLGLERTPEEYVANMVNVFREVRRVLKPSGTCWLNLGDSYASSPPGNTTKGVSGASTLHGVNGASGRYRDTLDAGHATKRNTVVGGLKPKDLIGIPWRVAFALQADGWYLRSDIIWSKPNPMPESVTDRPTKSHEYLFLLTKSPRYYFDADAVREADSGQDHARARLDGQPSLAPPGQTPHRGIRTVEGRNGSGRNIRSVWNIATRPYPGAHFAVFPPELPERCIKAGSSERGVCPECGKPWERVVERKATGSRPGGVNRHHRDDVSRGTLSEVEGYETQTTGWRATCDDHWGRLDLTTGDPIADRYLDIALRTETMAEQMEELTRRTVADEDITDLVQKMQGPLYPTVKSVVPVPAVVLDPFGGSGTVGMVANRLSRRAILVDLNPEYLKQQMTRNSQVPLGLTEGDAA